MKVNVIERLNSITQRVTALDIVMIYNNLHATETILYKCLNNKFIKMCHRIASS